MKEDSLLYFLRERQYHFDTKLRWKAQLARRTYVLPPTDFPAPPDLDKLLEAERNLRAAELERRTFQPPPITIPTPLDLNQLLLAERRTREEQLKRQLFAPPQMNITPPPSFEALLEVEQRVRLDRASEAARGPLRNFGLLAAGIAVLVGWALAASGLVVFGVLLGAMIAAVAVGLLVADKMQNKEESDRLKASALGEAESAARQRVADFEKKVADFQQTVAQQRRQFESAEEDRLHRVRKDLEEAEVAVRRRVAEQLKQCQEAIASSERVIAGQKKLFESAEDARIRRVQQSLAKAEGAVRRRVAEERKVYGEKVAAFQCATTEQKRQFESAEDNRIRHVRGVLAGEAKAMLQELKACLPNIHLPISCTLSIELGDAGYALLGAKIPGLEIIPTTMEHALASGRTSYRPKSGRAIRDEFTLLCTSAAFALAAEILSRLPTITFVVVNEYVSRLDPGTGKNSSQCILAVCFGAEQFKRLNLHGMDPLAAIQGFAHRLEPSRDDLKTIEPFTFESARDAVEEKNGRKRPAVPRGSHPAPLAAAKAGPEGTNAAGAREGWMRPSPAVETANAPPQEKVGVAALNAREKTRLVPPAGGPPRLKLPTEGQDFVPNLNV